MKPLIKSVAVLLFVAAASGCASPRAYFADRWNDAKDIFTVTVQPGAGAKARIGPVHAGLIVNIGSSGLRNGEFGTSGGHGTLEGELLVFPFDWRHGLLFSGEGVEIGYERGKDYLAIGQVPFVTTNLGGKGKSPAYYSQIEVSGGLLVTARLGFNPGELLDFFLGWFGADIYNDDIKARKEKEEKEKKEKEEEEKTEEERKQKALLEGIKHWLQQ